MNVTVRYEHCRAFPLWSITKQDKATKEYLREIQNVNIETGLQNHETL